jgi:hypothetical protein
LQEFWHGLTSKCEAPRNANSYKPGRGKTVAHKFRACDGRVMAIQELFESDPLVAEGPAYDGVGLAIFDYL